MNIRDFNQLNGKGHPLVVDSINRYKLIAAIVAKLEKEKK